MGILAKPEALLSVILVLSQASQGEACTFEQIPQGIYSVEALDSITPSDLKSCLQRCFGSPLCVIAAHTPDGDICKLFQNSSKTTPITLPFNVEFNIYRLNRHLERPSCPKLNSLP
ncbi:unnamed protein product [Nippostrongylus brasiliensis]|uniref:Apple domain-containing protein n=1 Tax=Nippostrongylus brasiliensis TaxID=27835 RepID=A0A0N4Y521_NIPBR|nr:hypothetical protein Q1695_013099 [Nippostrongylus brasiliensis]VDL74643.1 unnamed protein product [Nippostrongylus brasiliensis]